ncbi:MAG: nucleotidyltransferase family protein [bacterium]
MKAFILAAGKGARLAPLTDALPKILVPVLGVPMLERLRCWLLGHGVTALALNTHHLAQAVGGHLENSPGRAPAIRIFHEPELLGTGGALVNAASFWGSDPLLVWNGDILCDLDPRHLLEAHRSHGAKGGGPPLATLAVQERPGDSHLLVDLDGTVCGLDSARRGVRRLARRLGNQPAAEPRPMGFNGISILAPELLHRLPHGLSRHGAFDIIDALLDVIAGGAETGTVGTFDVGSAFYGTTGTPEKLATLERELSTRPDLLASWTP